MISDTLGRSPDPTLSSLLTHPSFTLTTLGKAVSKPDLVSAPSLRIPLPHRCTRPSPDSHIPNSSIWSSTTRSPARRSALTSSPWPSSEQCSPVLTSPWAVAPSPRPLLVPPSTPRPRRKVTSFNNS